MSDKPLIEMEPEELERTFDEIGRDLNEDLLNDARKARSRDEEVIKIVTVALVKDGKSTIVHHTCEYGDDDGASNMRDTRDEFIRSGLLKDGESLVLREHTLTVPTTTN